MTKDQVIELLRNLAACARIDNRCLNDVKIEELANDAISLLTPQVMTLEEVKSQQPDEDTDDNWMWIEYRDGCVRLIHYVKFKETICAKFPMGYKEIIYQHTSSFPYDSHLRELLIKRANCDTYGKTWRCWTSRPSDEQREATLWEG